jgi:hypothetical protein
VLHFHAYVGKILQVLNAAYAGVYVAVDRMEPDVFRKQVELQWDSDRQAVFLW